ncbi:Low-molecular weight cobalt-containing nitrile hydratase subunit alpha [Candidatus Entotheonellaceae bacterium PAL068K]
MTDAPEHTHAEGHTHPILSWSDDSEHDVDETARYPLMTEAIRHILVEKGIITADDVRHLVEQMDARSDATGGAIVARAWVDPAFKERLLANGKEAIAELGLPKVDASHLIVIENTETVHNVVVCTLCSCYPILILGLPPEWYKSKAYRSRVVIEPRAVLKEFGTELADQVTVRVHDSNADMRYLVLPMRPQGTEDWSEDELARIVTRDCMVGVTVPRIPTPAKAAE